MLFATLALVLSVVGVYGVLSYTVAQRRREIGLRMALGARPADVVRQVAAQGLWTVLLGIVVGTVGAVALAQLLSAFLHGFEPVEAVAIYLGSALALTAVAMVAVLVPARRASQLDPVSVLRYE